MLKLVRNTLGDKKSIVDGNGELIKWDYVVNLHKLQEQEGLHLGNRLRSAHIAWEKNKMNVRLAAQLLSESVANSLEFCVKEGLTDFSNCEPTVKFLHMFNKLFDLLNSRNLHGFGFKAPLQEKNIVAMRAFLQEVKGYIMSLKESRNGRSILQSNRKTGFLGFCICIDSVLTHYDFLMSSQFGFKFLCTFKFSQDHLELFFSKIRRMGGCNNNPSARKFIAAYRKLVVHSDLQDVVRGNCLPLDVVPILTASSYLLSDVESEPPSVTQLNMTVTRSRIIDPDDCAVSDHDYTFIPTSSLLSSCSEKIVAYIAGFVVYKLKTALRCESCISALTDDASDRDVCRLIKLKSKGSLIFPSEDVINVCITCEKFFRRNVSLSNTALPRSASVHAITQSVLESFVNKDCFKSLRQHMLECEPMDNHIVLLLKAIVEKYLQVRYHYAGKQYTAKCCEKQRSVSRQVNTKLVLFTGQ